MIYVMPLREIGLRFSSLGVYPVHGDSGVKWMERPCLCQVSY
jgi:hypothetical protein